MLLGPVTLLFLFPTLSLHNSLDFPEPLNTISHLGKARQVVPANWPQACPLRERGSQPFQPLHYWI